MTEHKIHSPKNCESKLHLISLMNTFHSINSFCPLFQWQLIEKDDPENISDELIAERGVSLYQTCIDASKKLELVEKSNLNMKKYKNKIIDCLKEEENV